MEWGGLRGIQSQRQTDRRRNRTTEESDRERSESEEAGGEE